MGLGIWTPVLILPIDPSPNPIYPILHLLYTTSGWNVLTSVFFNRIFFLSLPTIILYNKHDAELETSKCKYFNRQICANIHKHTHMHIQIDLLVHITVKPSKACTFSSGLNDAEMCITSFDKLSYIIHEQKHSAVLSSVIGQHSYTESSGLLP